MTKLLLKRIKDWETSITSFRTGDVIPVDGPSGTAKMSKDDLLKAATENSRSPDKAFVYSELPAENFGLWESGTFNSEFVDWENSTRARTKETFLAEKDLTFTFHIPDGYKLYINWTTSTSADRVWRTGTTRVHIPAGDYYRIAYAKSDDSDITAIAGTIYEASGIFVDEDFYSAQEIREDVEKNTASHGLMGTNYKWTSRHFVCVSDGFKIEDRLNRAYIVKKTSGPARCKVAILGKPSNDYKMSFKVGNPIGNNSNAMHEIHFTDVNNVHHKLLNQDARGYYSTTWYLDGVDTGGCWFLPIEFSFDGSNFKVIVDNGVPKTIYESNANAKDIHFETYMQPGREVFLEDYKQEGYSLKIPTSSMPFPFTEGVDVHGTTLYCGYWNAFNKLEIYSRDLLTGEEHTRTFDSIELIQDSHNYVALGVDMNGGIHVGCNCHYSPLVYLYGDDLDSVAVSSKLSEPGATYPSFFKFGGNFYATYRELTSNSGRWKVYLYDAEAKTFSATTDEYIARGDNSSPTACPYLQKWVVDEDGGWCYNSFVWRDSGDNSTNHDFFAFKTQDFQTFYNLNDEALTLPIDLSNCQQCQLDAIPKNSHLLNQQTNVVVIDGAVIALNFHDDDEGNTNLFAYKYKDGAIIKKCVSRFFGVGLYPVFAQSNVCSGCAKIIVYTNHGSDRQDGSRTANIYLDKDLNWWTDKDVEDVVKSASGKIRYPYNGKVKAINENYCFPGCFSVSNCGFIILE